MSPDEGGDNGAEDVPSPLPPDPRDRPWVHPSELRSFVAVPIASREFRPGRWLIGIGSAIAAVLGTVLVLLALGAIQRPQRPVPTTAVLTSGRASVDFGTAQRVLRGISPSVVSIRVEGVTPRPVGSGVALRSHRVITNAHLVAGATSISVVTRDGEDRRASVMGVDPQTDLALLNIPSGHLTLATLGSSQVPNVGNTVVAVGAGDGTNVTLGIDVISDHNVLADTGTGTPVAGLIETGIVTTPEMDGGALVDGTGNVVGILSAAPSDAHGSLAVPIGVVVDVQDQLEGSGKVSHGWLGALCARDPANGGNGARLLVVPPHSPAYNAGLRSSDIVTRAGGQTVRGMADLIAAARTLHPQDPLEVTYKRGGHEHHAVVALGSVDLEQLSAYPDMG